MTRWYGKLLGFLAGWLLMRHPAGAVIGLLVGHAFDADWFNLARKPDPYKVFNLTPQATEAEIDQAYRRLMSQYHPDKVSSAGEGPRKEAEKKASEINAAYDRIKSMRKG